MLPQRNWRDLIKPKKLDAEDKNASAAYCKFVGEPFERGFGMTVGNSSGSTCGCGFATAVADTYRNDTSLISSTY